jgi:lysophospholipid acyltransferase (LPLAT)-like uncharacterized protein
LTSTNRFSKKQILIIKLSSLLAPLFIRMLGWLCRYEVEDEHHFKLAIENGKGVILSIWHGRMLLLISHHRHSGIVTLVSKSYDGELIAQVVNKLGLQTHRGSPKEGGGEGFKLMLRDLKNGKTVGMFPDGPTGPMHFVRDGTLHLARLSGAPIVPAIFSANPCWRAGSWDRFMVMKPFSKGILKYGEPIFIPRRFGEDQDMEYFRDLIRSRMIDLENELDRRVGN